MKLKAIRNRDKDNTRRLKWVNHFFFATAVLFVIHQNALHPERASVEAPIVAQALQFQPQTPPPALDLDQLSNEEIDLTIRPEQRLERPD